ncbi:hypothetical protein AB0M91_30340 [Micromonospora rifamycinica]|uniref:hypothetical protein n=1 Tax=Micromonospora rifamycinica TaxID=291594 RepID=UPI0034173A5E
MGDLLNKDGIVIRVRLDPPEKRWAECHQHRHRRKPHRPNPRAKQQYDRSANNGWDANNDQRGQRRKKAKHDWGRPKISSGKVSKGVVANPHSVDDGYVPDGGADDTMPPGVPEPVCVRG